MKAKAGLFTASVIVLSLFLFGAVMTAEEPGKSDAGSVDIEKLIETASRASGTDSEKAILKLRDLGDAKAVNALERILVAHKYDTFGYAAAQALFCTGTEDAHAILKKHLLTSDFRAANSVYWTSEWEMKEPARSEFIRKYHLVNTTKDLKLTLGVLPAGSEAKRSYEIFLTIKNVSKKPVRIFKTRVFIGKHLFIASPEGNFVRGSQSVKYRMRLNKEEDFPVLEPGASESLRVTAHPAMSSPLYDYGSEKILTLNCRDYEHYVKKAGKFKMCAMYYTDGEFVTKEAERLKLSNVWYGRVVSEPVEIEIKPNKE